MPYLFCTLWLFFCLTSTVFADVSGRVVAVADGDSITVLAGKKSHRVRLASVDAPEKGQAYFRAAKEFLSELVFQREVSVRPIRQDRYGREVGFVTRKDGLNVNEEMVRQGYAWWYEHYDPNNTRLQSLQSKARTARRGLWADPQPVNPREFRVHVKKGKLGAGEIKKSRQHICHAPGSKYYRDVKNFTAFESIADCLDSGGRLPRAS